MSQNAQILSALKNGERLTPLDALNRFGCLRFGARIYDLRKSYDIKTEIINKDGKRYAAYRLVEK